jgi:hypothetical protein
VAPKRDAAGREVQRTPDEAAAAESEARYQHAAWRARTDAMRLAAGRLPAEQSRRWWPVAALAQAAEQNRDAPAWAVTVWLAALLSQDRSIAPLTSEYLTTAHIPFGDYAMVWHLVEQLTTGRANPMPPPTLAITPTWRHCEGTWTAASSPHGDPLDGCLWQALAALLGDHRDDTVRVRENNLAGDHPVTRLATLLVGPRAADRLIAGQPHDPRLWGRDVLVRAAETLHGGPIPTAAADAIAQLPADVRAALADAIKT